MPKMVKTRLVLTPKDLENNISNIRGCPMHSSLKRRLIKGTRLLVGGFTCLINGERYDLPDYYVKVANAKRNGGQKRVQFTMQIPEGLLKK